MLTILLMLPLITMGTIWLYPNNKVTQLKEGAFATNHNEGEKGKGEEILWIAIGFSIITMIHTMIIVNQYDSNTSGFQFMELSYGKLGIDGISLWLVWLVSILMPIILLSTWKSVETNPKGMIQLLILISFWSYSVFLVLDVLLFYISFEGVLIPMYFLIGFYGGRNRKIHAGNQFFIYTLIGSLFLLLGVIILYIETGTSDYQTLLTYPISSARQNIIWWGFFIALAIKVPMIPMHIWLPEAHVEAPTSASVLLAAILLKLGSYGLLRYVLPLFPSATQLYTPIVITMCIVAIIYSSLACLALWDMKKLIAYSSIGHMNTATLAIFTNDYIGISASIYFLISHGLISSGLFILIGILYDRYHTRTIKYYRGLVLIMPLFTTILLFFTLSNIAVPGTSGFISEFFTFMAAFNLNPFVAILASLAIILAPAYSLWFFHKISYGTLSPHLSEILTDISKKEFNLLFPLGFLTIYLGLNPSMIFDTIQLSSLSLII